MGRRPPAAAFEQIPLSERDLLRALLRRPSWLPELAEICGEGGIRDGRVAAIVEAIGRLHSTGEVGEPVPVERLLAELDVEGAPELLSRLTLEADGEPDHAYARACALGVRRDRLRRELRAVQRQIEETLARGHDDVAELERHKLRLAQEIRGV